MPKRDKRPKVVGLVLDFNGTIYQDGINQPFFDFAGIDYDDLEVQWDDYRTKKYGSLSAPEARQFKPHFIYKMMKEGKLRYQDPDRQPAAAYYSVKNLREFGQYIKLMDGVIETLAAARGAIEARGFEVRVALITSTPRPVIEALTGITFDLVYAQDYKDTFNGAGLPAFAMPFGSAGTVRKPHALRHFLESFSIDPKYVVAIFDGYSDEALAKSVHAGGGLNIGVVNRDSKKVMGDISRLQTSFVKPGLIADHRVVDNGWTEAGLSRSSLLEAIGDLPLEQHLDEPEAAPSRSRLWPLRRGSGRRSQTADSPEIGLVPPNLDGPSDAPPSDPGLLQAG